MTSVEILEVPNGRGDLSYQAVTAEKQSLGRTAGEALDALTAQLSEDEGEALIIVRKSGPDRFFGEAQQRRLAELMDRWRLARDSGSRLPDEEQAELEALVEAELDASARRTAALADALGR